MFMLMLWFCFFILRRKTKFCFIIQMKWRRMKKLEMSACVKLLYSLQGKAFKCASAKLSEFLQLTLENRPQHILFTFLGPLVHQSLRSLYIHRRIGSSSTNQKKISGWSWYLHTQYIFLKL